MFTTLFLLLASLNPHRPAAASAALADDIVAVVTSEPPLFPGGDIDAARLQTSEVVAAFVEAESGGEAKAVGDTGRSCGPLQTGAVARVGHSCDAVRNDRRLGIRLGLRWMIRMRDECGSVLRGLGAFASGRCGGARALVLRRCVIAGVVCE